MRPYGSNLCCKYEFSCNKFNFESDLRLLSLYDVIGPSPNFRRMHIQIASLRLCNILMMVAILSHLCLCAEAQRVI
jgi:hypothetical protein